jgi:dipeptidyl aminopeptidase/acylaminoacyl peptidase
LRHPAWLRATLAAEFLLIGMSAKAAPSLQTYGKLPAIDLVRVSPVGDKIAFVSVDGDNRRLFIRRIGGGALLVSNVGTSKIRGMEWAGDDLVLIAVSATVKIGGGTVSKFHETNRFELYAMIVADLKTQKIYQMFQQQLGYMYLAGSLFDSVEISGRWYDVVEAWNAAGTREFYKVELESGKYVPLTGYELRRYSCFIDSTGHVAARARYDEYTRKWSLFAGDQGGQTIAVRHSDWARIEIAGAGRTEGTVLVREQTPKTDTADEYPIRADARPSRLFDGAPIEDFLRDPVTHLLVGAALPDGRVILLDQEAQRRFDAVRKAFPGLRVRLQSFSSGMSKIVVETDGGDDAGTYWLIDMKTGKADDLMSAYPGIDAKDVGPTRIFAYAAGDGLPLEGVLTLPPGGAANNLPLVVMPHGGPIGVHDEVGFDFWAQAFASRGYVVFQPNYRGSDGRGASFENAGLGQWGGRILTDITDGVAALAKTGLIDPKRVCVVGASYGGYAALASVTIRHEGYRCAVAVSGVSDVGALMLSDGFDPAFAAGRYAQAYFGVDSPLGGALGPISPLEHVATADAPILMIHGEDDTVVPFVHSSSMQTALAKAGKTSELIVMTTADHSWAQEATRQKVISASVAFVQEYNPS